MKKKIIYLALYFIFNHNSVFAQFNCTTPSNVPNLLQNIPQNQFIQAANNYVIRIFVHTIRRSNGTGGQSATDLQQALNTLVADYATQNICISLLGTDEILNDTYYSSYTLSTFTIDANGDGKFDNFSPNSHANAVDIYLFPVDGGVSGGLAANITATALVVGGVAYGSNLASSHVLSHELGHCLGLYHTFHGLCESGCPELVNESNCTTCGDFVCDTRPDPQAFQVSTSCVWNGTTCTGSTVDANGQPYNPMLNLIMAYIPPTCMQLFTSGQGTRMRSILANSTLLQNIIVPSSLTLSSLDILGGVNRLYDVTNTITTQTNVLVEANGSLTLRAGNLIDIKTFFDSKTSSNFHAYLDNTCSTVDQSNFARKSVQTKVVDNLSVNKSDNFKLDAYPNPFVGNKLFIDVYSETGKFITIKIIAVNGKILKMMNYNMNTKNLKHIQLNIPTLAGGAYFIQASNGYKIITKKIIKTEYK